MAGSWQPFGYQRIVDWVDRHRGALPTSLAELSRYPVAFRRVIVNAVPPEVRERLWAEHMRDHLSDAALNAEQRAFIEATIEELPCLLAAAGPHPALTDWERRASALFPREVLGHLAATIGPPEPPGGLPPPPDF